jgi:SpoVK/Ycf46/Vps4 family AAA+-type ATPase
MSDNTEGKFVLKKMTPFKDVAEGKTTELSESDLCFQDELNIYQFKFEKPEKEYKEMIKPGIYVLEEVMSQIRTKESELRTRTLLTSVVNTQAIINEAEVFFKNLDVYEELGEQKARKILLYSDPGMGKSATISMYCQHAIKEDPGTVVLIWPTSQIESSDILNFLSKNSEYTAECTRMILLIEDIGGGEREGSGNARAVDNAMLDLLDGLQITFKLPTLIIATTNYPQNLLSALADRPGRFDLLLKLNPPSFEERVMLVEFIAKRKLTDSEVDALNISGSEKFSVAHLKEVVIRSRLHKRSMREVVNELIKHRKRFDKAFEDKESNKSGFGFDLD